VTQEIRVLRSGETYRQSGLDNNITATLERKLGNYVTIDGHTTNMFAGIVRLSSADDLYILSGNSLTFKSNPYPWTTQLTTDEIMDSITLKRKLRVRIRGNVHAPAVPLLDAMRGWAVMQGMELIV
jgi:hypothetical protein